MAINAALEHNTRKRIKARADRIQDTFGGAVALAMQQFADAWGYHRRTVERWAPGKISRMANGKYDIEDVAAVIELGYIPEQPKPKVKRCG